MIRGSRSALLFAVLALLAGDGRVLLGQTLGEGADARSLTEEDTEALQRWAGLRLAELDSLGSGRPPTLAEGTERVWALYFLSVGEKERVGEAQALARELRERSVPAAAEASTLEALDAALEVVRAKHSRWPPNKLKHLRAGLESLDRLVAQDPDHLAIRYLRLASCFYLPFFLKREESVSEDMKTLIERLPDEPGTFAPMLLRGVALFLLQNGDMSPEARARLQEAIG